MVSGVVVERRMFRRVFWGLIRFYQILQRDHQWATLHITHPWYVLSLDLQILTSFPIRLCHDTASELTDSHPLQQISKVAGFVRIFGGIGFPQCIPFNLR